VDRPAEVAGRPAVPLASGATSITAVLLGAGASASQGHVQGYIAAARISPDDLAEQADRAARGGTGAGASNLLELANVDKWTTSLVARSPDVPADATLLSQQLPPAPLYEITAYDYRADRYYHAPISAADLRSTTSRIELAPVAATGIAIQLRNAEKLGTALLGHLERRVSDQPGEPARAGAVLQLTRLFRPDVASMLLDETPALLPTTGTTTLAPLPPDPALAVRLATATGLETGPVEVRLQQGTITNAAIDCAALFPPQDVTGMILHTRLLLEPSDEPLSGAAITRLRGDEPIDEQVTDANGLARFDAVPLSTATTFEYHTTETAPGVRPLAPRTRFTFNPPQGEPAETSVTWQLRPYGWIVLKKPDRTFERPYPIYVLQMEIAVPERWVDWPLDLSVETEGSISISVPDAFVYRIAAVLSPLEICYSDFASVGPLEEARLSFPDCHPRTQYRLSVKRTDGSSYSGPARVYHRFGGVRPASPANVSDFTIPAPSEPLTIEIEIPGYPPIEKQVPADLPANAEITIDLPATPNPVAEKREREWDD
jgi:hypothetical protein